MHLRLRDIRGFATGEYMTFAKHGMSIVLLATLVSGPVFAQTISVPVVGCVSEGQSGPIPAPAESVAPRIPVGVVTRLAWYASRDLGVLGPRGWKCLGLHGSNGVTLFVVPDDPRQLASGHSIRGQGIQLSKAFGDTSGRFEAAMIASRLFPNRQAFIDSVANEGIVPKEALASAAFPDNRVHRLGPDQVSFETPANQEGLGTMSRMLKMNDPIQGMATMNANNDATLLVVRLHRNLRELTATILGASPP
jgi:hypothetical protein